FVSKIINKKTALILGAGLSSTTGPFNERWAEYEDIFDTLTTAPDQVEGFINLYSHGGVSVQPKNGNGMIPNLVQSGFVTSILTFNYNCHVEYCLSMCKIGYQSLIYNGEEQVERITVGDPQCQIFKPHGSARIMQNPTQIIWPERHPFSNLYVCEKFVEDIKRNKVEQILILGWSGNYDSHIRPFLEDLFDSGVEIFHIGLPHHTDTSVATVGWGVVHDFICDFTDGAIDVLYGITKMSGVTVPCVVDDDPLTRLSTNLKEIGIEQETIPIR
ncbi:MAG: hypothetical protein ACFFEV_01410, partial [Candidatus Thorarchaeota archaeon]